MKTWVLLRGLMRDSRHWDDFPMRLTAAMPGTEAVTLDLPGNGSLHRMASPVSVEAMAAWCREELQSRGLAPPYGILAMSLGAMVAASWAMDHPSEVQACVLINTSLRPSPMHWRLRPRNYGTLLKLALFGGTDEEWEAGIYRLTSNRPTEAARIVPRWSAWRREHPVSRINALRQLVAASRYMPPKDKPEPPVLLLASTNDALVDVRCSRDLAARWQAELHEHPTAGHDIPLDDGDWVVAQVSMWTAHRGKSRRR